jgi:hypothetical protein
LPAKIAAATIEDDIYEVELKKAKINKSIGDKVFDVKIPKSFGEPEIIPLEKNNSS